MKTSRLLASVVTAGALAAGTLVAGAPAQAATAYTTTTVLTTEPTAVDYGDTLSISGQVNGADAAGNTRSPSNAVVSLQVYTPSNPVWTEVATDDSAFFFFSDVKPLTNAQYKVVYAGGTSTLGDTFTASESAPLVVGVNRKVNAKILSSSLTVKFTVKPDYAKKPVKVFIKKGKKFKPLKKAKTDKKGKVSIKFPGKKGGGKLFFRVVIPGDANYLPFSEDYVTTVYRASARTSAL